MPVINNFMSILCKLIWFLNVSSKQENIMEDILKTEDDKELDFDMLHNDVACIRKHVPT